MVKKKWATTENNVVILHQFSPGRFTPCTSPFALKLETYLRMTKISYQNDFSEPMGPKGKTPWITLNGVDTADSQLCLEFIAKHFNKDFSSHLTEQDRAIARGMQIMAEEHLYWVVLLWRWVYDEGKSLPRIQSDWPWYLRLAAPLIRYKLKGNAVGQGIGRHTQKEVYEMGLQDLRALSAYLGEKPFCTGQSATELDCAIFGSLAQLLWNAPGCPYENLFNNELSNLKDFCLRMKEAYWPDWDNCLKP